MSVAATSTYNRLTEKPAWLAGQLAEAARLLPGVDLHVMFGDDLPHTTEMFSLFDKAGKNNAILTSRQLHRAAAIYRLRHAALTRQLTERFDNPALAKEFADSAYQMDKGLAFGVCTSSLRYEVQDLYNNCGERIIKTPINQLETAFVMLAPSFLDSASMMAFACGLHPDDCGHNSPSDPHLASWLHERGHLQLMLKDEPIINWYDEYTADQTASTELHDACRPDLATRHLLMRAATNFLGEVTLPATAYWNVLTQSKVLPYNSDGILRDKSATLELHQQAASLLKESAYELTFDNWELRHLQSGLNAPRHKAMRRMFDADEDSSMQRRKVLMHALDRVVERDMYAYPETRTLAHLTRHALHAYFPTVLADKSRYRPYLKDNAPAP